MVNLCYNILYEVKMDFFLILIGFFLLINGANFLVDGGASLAKKLNVPTIVIGLTIIAFGTSSPELIVNIIASVKRNSDIVLGNILGSNIFNILGILGISAILYPLKVSKTTTLVEIPIMILSSFILFILSNDAMIDKKGFSEITRIDGIVLLSFFLFFIGYNIYMGITRDFELGEEIKDRKLTISILMIVSGFVFLFFGGRIVVDSSIRIARFLGISERVISLTIVAIGTSLPELITSIVAAIKRHTDISIGNIVGSNIFNSFFIIGISGIIYPVQCNPINQYDFIVNIFVSLLTFFFLFTGKKHILERWEGILFVALQIVYFFSLFILT